LTPAERTEYLAMVNTMFWDLERFWSGYSLYYIDLDARAEADAASTAGQAFRTLDNFAYVLPFLDTGLADEPTGEILTPSYSPVTFPIDFRVTHPEGLNNGPLLDAALDSRTGVYMWYQAGGSWTRVELWPSPPPGTVWGRATSPPLAQGTLTLSSLGFLPIEAKFVLVTHDTNDRWDMDTSVLGGGL
jgi:hypothetical protein